MMTLNDGKKKKTYKIKRILGECDGVSRRFVELGIYSGEKVRIVEFSTLKKVALIEIKSYVLSIRTSLLARIEVEA